MFKDNLTLRIVSLLFAIFIWLQSVLVSEQKSVVNLPINLMHVPQNITLENVPNKIPFQVKGKGLDIFRLLIHKPRVNIDASRITPKTDILTLTDYSIDLPDNIEVSFLGPAQSDKIAIQADVFHQKIVPVVLDFSDETVKNRIKDLRYTLQPDKITVFGPKNRIQGIHNVKTVPVAPHDFSERESKLSLVLPDEEVSISESSVMLQISGAQEATKVYSNISLPGNYLPAIVAVKVQAESALLERLKSSDIRVKASTESDENGMYSVEVSLPEKVQLIAVTPSKVQLRK
ncbi:MAG: hypothetical protein PHC50_10135 [Candidatus Cloacimonetes bacterium]|nr:hypothetical protein [Candidatus Cloacimonadota bacterium]